MKEEIRKLIADTLGAPMQQIGDNTEIGELENWDSIHQLMIISELEEKYHLHFSEDDIFDMTSVGDIIEVMQKRIGNP